MKNKLFLTEKINLYRIILVVAAAFYIGFGIFYQTQDLVDDPISFNLRLLKSLILLGIVTLTYTSRWVKEQIFFIMYALLYFPIGYLIYLAYIDNFSFNYLVSLIIIIFIVNLIYEINIYLAHFNLLLNLVVIVTTYLAGLDLAIQVPFVLALAVVSLGSFLLSYSQQKSQQRSKEVARKYKDLVKNLPIGLARHKIILDDQQKPIDYIFLEVNEAFEEMTGLKEVEIINKRISNVITDIEGSGFDWIKTYGKVALTGQTVEFEEYSKPLDRWYHVIAYSHEKDYFTTSVIDITEKKLAQDKIEATKKMLEKLAEQVPGTIYQYQTFADGSSCFPFASQGIYDVYEVYPSQVKEDASIIFERLYQKDKQKVKFSIERSAKEMTVWHQEYRVDLPKKGLRWVEGIAKPEKKVDGSVLWHGYIKDITERKTMEKQLKRTVKETEKASKAKSEFLANMSHEIRTPLNAVIGFSQILEKELKDTRQQSYLNSIKTASHSLLTLINDILDMSKIEAGMLEANLSYFKIAELLTEMKTIFSKKIRDKDLEFILEDNLADIKVKLDKSKLRQILVNLVGNAVKFTKAGYVKVIVKGSKIDQAKIDLELVVEDSGIGIVKKEQANIFAAFTQQDGQSTREYGGTGLGLTITKNLTELLGGAIDLESEKGVGSKFMLKFPAVEFKKGVKEDKKLISNAEIEFKQAEVLIVDDVKSNRELLEIKLKNKGLDIFVAKNGQVALNLLKKRDFDLVITDLKMSKMDGYQLLAEIKKLDNKLNVLAFTAAATIKEKKKVKQAGFVDFLIKPVDDKKLFKKLAKYLPHQIKKGNLKEQVLIDLSSAKIDSEIMLNLKEEFCSKVQDIKEVLIINEVEEFADELYKFGKKHQIKSITDYAKQLEKELSAYNLDAIEQIILEIEDFLKD